MKWYCEVNWNWRNISLMCLISSHHMSLVCLISLYLINSHNIVLHSITLEYNLYSVCIYIVELYKLYEVVWYGMRSRSNMVHHVTSCYITPQKTNIVTYPFKIDCWKMIWFLLSGPCFGDIHSSSGRFPLIFLNHPSDTVDDSEIPRPTTSWMYKTRSWDKLPTSTGWPDFFHQQ